MDPEILDEIVSMLDETRQTNLGRTRDEPPSRSGGRFGRYQLCDLLGSGGRGEVYSAVDPELDRKVAIKFRSHEMAARGTAVDRLIREAKAASALNHPHITTVYEVIHTKAVVAIRHGIGGGPYASQVLREAAGDREGSRLWAPDCPAARGRTSAQYVHRDVKPENLMVRDDGILKILDGLAGESNIPQIRSDKPQKIAAP